MRDGDKTYDHEIRSIDFNKMQGILSWDYGAQWRIQDFPEEGRQLSGGGGRQDTILLKFPENCMKLKKIRPPGGGAASPAPPLRSATGAECFDL